MPVQLTTTGVGKGGIVPARDRQRCGCEEGESHIAYAAMIYVQGRAS